MRKFKVFNGDDRAAAQLANQDSADPLGVDLEATRQAMLVSIRAEEQRQAALDATRPVLRDVTDPEKTS